MGIIFGTSFFGIENANATCINYIQSQTIAAAYDGDAEPTVHTMDTCSGDDISYQIPIATTVTFDGVQYENIYATTNSVITFGQPDPTYWAYPNTPSISLYSMDWYPGANNTSGLDIYYSEGGFQINLNMVPFGMWNAEPSTVNILVAITNTGSLAVSYSYQGPEYQNLRTGVRLHDGSIVSLEAWGATQVQAGSTAPTLAPEPIPDPSSSPTPTPMPTPSETPITAEEQQAQVAEATELANDINNLNNLIASINGDEIESPDTTPTEEPSPEPSNEPTTEPDLPEPDIIVEPEIVTPEDPRFPDNEEIDSNPTENPTDSEPSDVINEDPIKETEPIDIVDNVVVPTDNNFESNAISEEELKKLNNLISANDAKLLAQLIGTNETVKQAVEEFTKRAEENADAPMPYTIADAITEVQAEQILEDPVGAVTAIFTEIDMEVLTSPTEWGKDMTDDQREKVQEIVVSVIIASNLVSASMTRRK